MNNDASFMANFQDTPLCSSALAPLEALRRSVKDKK